MAYDEAHQVVVLFGGTDRFLTVPGSANRSDTWIWDGSTWTQRQPAQAPSLAEAVMSFDQSSRSVLLFGTTQGGPVTAETWIWDGNQWKQALPARSPSGRLGASLAYDVASQRVLLFGGFNQAEGFQNDTWTWDGSSWIQEHPPNAPPARQLAAMTGGSYGILLFGGDDGHAFGDTWLWNGVDWLLLKPCTAPRPRTNASIAYDGERSVLVMFGGIVVPAGAPGGFSSETWMWNGTDWTAAR